jgi:hypothetical protein
MSWRRDRFVLLGALLALWGWVLWGQLGKRAGATPAAGPVSPAAPGGPPAVEAPRPVDPRAPEEIAGPAVVEAQERASRLPLGPDPLFPDPPKVEATPVAVREAPEEAPAVLSSTFRGGLRPSAVINGVRFHEGDAITPAMTLRRVGDGWVEVEVSGSVRKVTLSGKSERGSRKADGTERKGIPGGEHHP